MIFLFPTFGRNIDGKCIFVIAYFIMIDFSKKLNDDYQGIGSVNPAHYWEERRNVSEILLHPDCNPGNHPQHHIVTTFVTTFNTAKATDLELGLTQQLHCTVCTPLSSTTKNTQQLPLRMADRD